MSECQRCGSERIVEARAKCSDSFSMEFPDGEYRGYVPDEIGIGGGDMIVFDYCLECGQLQGVFPIPDENLPSDEDEGD